MATLPSLPSLRPPTTILGRRRRRSRYPEAWGGGGGKPRRDIFTTEKVKKKRKCYLDVCDTLSSVELADHLSSTCICYRKWPKKSPVGEGGRKERKADSINWALKMGVWNKKNFETAGHIFGSFPWIKFIIGDFLWNLAWTLWVGRGPHLAPAAKDKDGARYKPYGSSSEGRNHQIF